MPTTTTTAPVEGELVLYDAACRALAEAKSVDEVKDIRDQAIAMATYARQAKNRDLEADAVEIRMRATRRLDQMRQEQKATVGLAQGTRGSKIKGARVDEKPTLASQGIDKNLAQQARVLGSLSDQKFEEAVSDARDAATRTMRRVINAAAIEQERAAYKTRAEQGGTIDDLVALAASGRKFNVIFVDVPSKYKTYSDKGKQRSAERYYDTMDVAALNPLIQALAAKDCALLYWTSGPYNKNALDVIAKWGFDDETTWAFVWVKTKASRGVLPLEDLQSTDLHMGQGYTTRSNVEVVLLTTKGAPMRLAADVHQVIVAPVGEHSEKPEEAARRIERLYPGPYLELFARREREGWTTWGNELPPPAIDADAAPPIPPESAPSAAPSPPSAPADDDDDIPEFLRRAAAP